MPDAASTYRAGSAVVFDLAIKLYYRKGETASHKVDVVDKSEINSRFRENSHHGMMKIGELMLQFAKKSCKIALSIRK